MELPKTYDPKMVEDKTPHQFYEEMPWRWSLLRKTLFGSDHRGFLSKI